MTPSEADYDVHALLPEALEELGLNFHPVDSAAGAEAAVRADARRVLTGELSPSDFTWRIHQRHGHELALTQTLAELDEYDILEYGDRTAATQIDAEVMVEAQRLAARRQVS